MASIHEARDNTNPVKLRDTDRFKNLNENICLNRLLVRQYKKYNRRLYLCPHCLHGCTSQRVLNNH